MDNLAQQLFDATHALNKIEGKVYDEIAYQVFGVKIREDIDPFDDAELDKLPFDSIYWDSYDSSVELLSVKDGVELTQEQQQKLWDMGFKKCFLIYGGRTKAPYKSKGKSYSKFDPFERKDTYPISNEDAKYLAGEPVLTKEENKT